MQALPSVIKQKTWISLAIGREITISNWIVVNISKDIAKRYC